MKKILLIVLAIAMIAALASCGKDKSSANTQNGTTSVKTESKNQPIETLSEFNRNATISETVMVDENNVKITATGINYTNHSAELQLMIENNSKKNLSFLSGTIGYSCNSINGIMVSDGSLNCDVAAGKKANDSIKFSYDSLLIYGITGIADMEIGFEIEDDDYNSTYTGPKKLKTSIADSYAYDKEDYRKAITSDACKTAFNYSISHFAADTIYNQNNISIVSEGLMVNKDDETILLMEAENDTRGQIYLETSKISINGLLVYGSEWSSDTINSGKRSIIDVKLSNVLKNSFRDAFGIKDIGEIKLNIEIKNADGNVIVADTPITVTISENNVSFDKSGTNIYENNNISIVSKGVVGSDSDYDKDMYVLLMIENNSQDTVSIDDVYDSLSVNGVMTDYIFTSQTVEAGSCAMLEFDLSDSSLEDNKISQISDIKSLEVKIEIEDSKGKEIDSPTLKVTY